MIRLTFPNAERSSLSRIIPNIARSMHPAAPIGGIPDIERRVEVMAWLLARDIDAVDQALREGSDLSDQADLGLQQAIMMLGAGNSRLKGPLRKKTRTEAAVRAALLQLALGDQTGARDTTRLMASDDHVVGALVRLCEDHFGFRPRALLGDSGSNPARTGRVESQD